MDGLIEKKRENEETGRKIWGRIVIERMKRRKAQLEGIIDTLKLKLIMFLQLRTRYLSPRPCRWCFRSCPFPPLNIQRFRVHPTWSTPYYHSITNPPKFIIPITHKLVSLMCSPSLPAPESMASPHSRQSTAFGTPVAMVFPPSSVAT